MKPQKTHIRRAFNNAAATYDSAAEVQRIACHLLIDRLKTPRAGSTLLDAGCGTGHGLRLLMERFPESCVWGLDIAPSMLARAKPLPTLLGDIEHLPLATASIDLYHANLSVQWCDPARVLGEARRVLRAGGQLALSTLGPDTFAELRTAFASGDRYAHTLDFISGANIAACAEKAGFSRISVEHRPLVSHHQDFRTLLASIKAVGANQLGAGRRHGLMSRSAFQRAEAALETLRQPEGLPLTYDLVFLFAETTV